MVIDIPTYPIAQRTLDVPCANAAGVTLLCVAIDLEATPDHPAFSALAEDERAHASRFIRNEDALRFLGARLALRKALGGLLGVPLCSLRLEKNQKGRPRLASYTFPDGYNAVDFNISHSGSYALSALGKGRRVGVDIECLDR